VASGLVSVFKKIWAESQRPRMEYILRNALLALLELPEGTLLHIPRLLGKSRKFFLSREKSTLRFGRFFKPNEAATWNQEHTSPESSLPGTRIASAQSGVKTPLPEEISKATSRRQEFPSAGNDG